MSLSFIKSRPILGAGALSLFATDPAGCPVAATVFNEKETSKGCKDAKNKDRIQLGVDLHRQGSVQ